jgi:xylan 1,4-beta-xylosidase
MKLKAWSFVLTALLLNANGFSQDTNRFVFLCFGQSNMEGFPGIEEQDKGPVDERFQVLAAVDFPKQGRAKGNWYPAVPPLCRPSSGLCPADYFGRTVVSNLPLNIRVGIVNVSVAGCKIELFQKDSFQTYASTAPNWMTNIIYAYGGNPYQRLVDLAKLAQKNGIIKGILLHQGESNTNDREWPKKVKEIYEDLLKDLNLKAEAAPLLAGELVNVDQNGACASMNKIINQLPRTIPTAHVVSSEGCAARPDHLHFTPAGYRELGRRYAQKMLSLLGYQIAEPTLFASSEVSPTAARHWTADNGNGTYSNPLFYGEFEDPDVIRVGDDYYLVGTTMHMNPALEILHSKDLVNWELAGYCMERLDFGPAFRLEGGNIYGRGIWAPCIRYHQGTFYIFSNVNGVGLQVFRSKSIQGPWERNQLPGRHDLSVLFDDDLNKIFIISSAGSRGPDGSTTYPIEELTPDLRAFDTNASKRQMLIPRGTRMGEGHHIYKINGKYYDISAIPGGAVDQVVARTDSIDGPWEVTYMVQNESMGVTDVAPARAQADNRGLWIHQGGICDTPSGEWWCVIMSDHGSAGRMVSLVPVTWAEGFPLLGLPGNLRKAPNTWIKPNTGFTQEAKPTYVWDENFDRSTLNPHWQWNHVPDDTKWSLTEKPGVLRLHSLPAANFYNARNSVCQRPPGPESIITVELDTTGMIAGDTAGLGLLSTPYSWIGVVKSAEGTQLQMFTGTGGGRGRRAGTEASQTNPPTVSPTTPPPRLWLRVRCDFDTDDAIFSWSADGKQFAPLGDPFRMTFQLTTFQGVRPSLFHYNTSSNPGGYADFDNYAVEEPRARGIEREIPLGKMITLTSGADGSFLAADTQNNALVNVAADASSAAPQAAKFQVVDLGKGRVALKASNGRFVSVAGETAGLKDIAGSNPSEAESFQWVNLMRGDTMLMSLTNHRYLETKPNELGQVKVPATSPTPVRKKGECFKWKTVE